MKIDLEKTIRDYLPDVLHMSLATVSGGQPWVCEVHFAYDDQLNLYFRSLPSRRHSQEIAQNPKVAGNIIKPHALGEPPFGVYFEGTAKQLKPGPEQDAALACLKQRLQIPNHVLEEAQNPKGQFYKITIQNFYVFGRLDGTSTQKYQLPWNDER